MWRTYAPNAGKVPFFIDVNDRDADDDGTGGAFHETRNTARSFLASAELKLRKWLREDVAYAITPEDAAGFRALKSGGAREVG